MSTDRYLVTAKRIFILLLLYTVCRVLFFLFNYKTFAQAEASSVLLAFVYGLRFDFSIVFSSNLLFIVVSILPFSIIESKAVQKFLKILFLVVNIPLLFMNLADTEYFKFTMKRTGYDVLGIMSDVQNQSFQLAFHYWYVPLLTVAMGYALLKFYDVKKVPTAPSVSRWLGAAMVIPVILLSVLIIRGGLQYKPMKPDHAFVQTPNVLGNLVLNTPYNFFTTMSFPRVETISYYASGEEVKSIIEQKNIPSEKASAKNTNVVIIILESFSREYMGLGNGRKGYTPFLDSLARKGTFFSHHFANGKRSIEAVPSIFASVPALMEEPYITGVYQGNELHGLAEILSQNGYRTAFFHGGRNGTMGFDKFSINAGFESYYGLDEYPEEERDFDGNWGIYDEPYLQYFCRTLTGFKKPFLASVFTLSSHQPYSVPPQYKSVFPKGELEIHESIGYGDRSLQNFFQSASKEDWYENTLFVITADHTQGLSTPEYQNTLGEYSVPLILFHPGKKILSDTSEVSQHLDIMPTVLDYTGLSNGYPVLFGRSLLEATEGRALFYSNKNYLYVKKEYYLEFDKTQSKLYSSTDWKKNREVKDQEALRGQYEKELKAYIQYYNNGLNNNNWYRRRN